MASPEPLTAGDWAGVVLVGLCVLFCIQFPLVMGPSYARMFADFGGALPPLTELALTIWFPLMLGLNPASVAFYAVAGPHRIGRRRLLIVASFAIGLVAVGVLLAAVYQPIFSLAGRIE